jgi:hypothetical protein
MASNDVHQKYGLVCENEITLAAAKQRQMRKKKMCLDYSGCLKMSVISGMSDRIEFQECCSFK